jgi:Tfp pilus assembly protein PilO
MSKLTPFILILVSIGIFFFFIDPQYKEIKELNIEKKNNQSTLADADRLDRRMREIQSQFNSFSENEKELLRKILPDQVDNVRLIDEIDKIASKEGVVIKDIGVVNTGNETLSSTSGNRNQNIINTSTNSRYGTITLSFNLTAPYPVFKNLMNELEESLRLVDIKKFSVKSTESDFYDFSVTLNTYWSR